MNMDIRTPIGLMFSLFGILLIVYGLITSGNSMYGEQSLGINVNLWWGVVVLLFGAITLILAWRGASRATSTTESAEGRAIEETERQRGLEH